VLEFRARGKEDHRGGGEDLWVLGIHMLDLIVSIGGLPRWCFARVTQDGQPVTRRHVVEGSEGIGPLAGDAVSAMYGMKDTSTAFFSSHRNARGNPWRYALQIFGSRGIIEIQEGTLPPVKYLADPSWCPGRSGARWKDVSSAGIEEPEPLKGPEYRARHHLAIRDFLQAIGTNRQPLCNASAARAATEMIVAVFESHRLGRPVPLPLKTRENPLKLLS
jgi:predicted dehydrogenase